MSWLTQTTRFLQLDLPLGFETLMPIEFAGIETLSQPFCFSVRMISDNTNIDPRNILGKPMTIQMDAKNAGLTRYFNGYVRKFKAEQVVQGTRYYSAEIQPWLSFLDYTSDCQVFQQKTVVQIAEMLFEQYGFTHFDFSGLASQYQSRNYCVQYRETALHFISRLFQEEGIYYFFKHEKTKHTLMLADSPAAIKPASDALAVYNSGSRPEKCITHFTRNYQFYSGKVTHTDYNHLTPDNPLKVQQQSNAKLPTARNYEHFDYPGLYQDNNTGESLAQRRFEAQEAQYDSLHGESNYSSFSSGSKFSIENAPISSDNGDYTLVSVTHHASDGSYLLGEAGNQSYSNLFTCIPATTPFKPPRNFIKPVVHGAQSAVVVGSPGEEINTCHYGEAMVQFHWDRKGKKNEYSSCWIRVAQLWAGKNWGALFMPRVGQEVIVHFLEGDPDRPIIMGSVYNADNMPPYELPGYQTKSGIRTASTSGAGPDEYNELSFEDNQGREEIYIQAQKDFNKLVKNNLGVTVQNDHKHDTANNSAVTVGNDYSHSTANNSAVFVGNDYSHTTASNSMVNVGNNYTHNTALNALIDVGSDLVHSVANNSMETIGNNYSHATNNDATMSVGHDYTHETANNASQIIGKDFSLIAGNNVTQQISQNLNTTVGSSASLIAQQEISLQVGSNTLVINTQGIYINGTQIKVNQTG